MASQHTANPMVLPDDLPRPVDDGGAAHLVGMPLPSIELRATSGGTVDLSKLARRTIVYAYPMTGVPNVELPPGWNDIPGARGCTPQTMSFQNQKDVISALGADLFGLSTQTPEYQQELSDRLQLSFPILSDSGFRLTEALRLPTMVVEGMRLMKRLTMIIDRGRIEHVFYPVFPPDRATADVIAWLRDHPSSGATMQKGVRVYTTSKCPYCKAAKDFLQQKGISFSEIDVEQEPGAAAIMLATTGRQTVPQIFFGSHHVGGSDDLAELEKSGRLESTLQAHAA
jgi:GrxC family glutaredoxin